MAFRLSHFAGLGDLQVLRDGGFARTGKLSTPLDGLLVPLRSERYLAEVNANPRIAAVITRPDLVQGLDARLAVAVGERPDDLHSEIHALCAKEREAELRAKPNLIDPDAQISPNASIAPYGVEIGAGVRIGPNVVIEPGVVVEQGCVLHPGVVLGGPGFNVGRFQGRQGIVPQLGGVRLKPFVELLSNVCVARAIFGGETTIGEETVMDSLVSVAHDCVIGQRVQVCALVNILGRVVVGDDAYLGPSSVIINGARLGAGARISMGAVVTRDVAPGETVTGNFAIPHERFMTHLRSIR